MDYNGFYEEYGQPFSGRKKKKLVEFLRKSDLDYDEQIEYTVSLVTEDGDIVATGSIHQNVLKCIAVSPRHQGLGLSAKIVTLLMNYGISKGQDHLFLFTKPKNLAMFSDLGFYKIIETSDILLMENRRNGIANYVSSLERPETTGTIGAIVANCNPFTKGHLYLIQEAASRCDVLHLFILSEDKSAFPADVRYRLVEKGVQGIENVVLHHTSDYLISSAVFPTYFIKDKVHAANANCELDIRIFCQYFAKSLGITKRFVGTEPFCQVTNSYNETMKKILPEYGVELIEIPRKEENNTPISASFVRKCMMDGDYDTLTNLVPVTTMEYILSEEGKALADHMAGKQEK